MPTSPAMSPAVLTSSGITTEGEPHVTVVLPGADPLVASSSLVPALTFLSALKTSKTCERKGKGCTALRTLPRLFSSFSLSSLSSSSPSYPQVGGRRRGILRPYTKSLSRLHTCIPSRRGSRGSQLLVCEYFASGRAGAPTPTQLVERTAPVSSKCDPLGSMLEESVQCAPNMHACPWDQVQMVAQNNAPSPFHASKETHRDGHAQQEPS